MRPLVEALCSDACAGRAPGTEGGATARAHVVEALRAGGLDPETQTIPAHGGANVLATLPGEIDRWVLVGAHYDHLGTQGGHVFRGADDNAAGVAILVEVAAKLAASRPRGRGVIVAAFDAEEPPWFLGKGMGSEHFARHPTVPLDRIDLMVCMDLVGHALGLERPLPDEVKQSVFALGAERSAGTAERLESMATEVPGVVLRRADGEVIPPLSDYDAFWRRGVPWLLLTCGRSRVYHTPDDVPALLDFGKMAALARWLELWVRQTCARAEPKLELMPDARDDAATLRSFLALARSLAPVSREAQMGAELATALLASCDSHGRVPRERRREVAMLVAALESGLA